MYGKAGKNRVPHPAERVHGIQPGVGYNSRQEPMTMTRIFAFFTDPDEEGKHRTAQAVFFLILLLIILAGWGYFLNWGRIEPDYHDWGEVNAPRLAFLKDAVTKGKLPLHMPDSSALRGVTDRYMALPDLILSPQVILLRWMSVGTFVLVHTWLMICLGYAGLLHLKKRFGLSLLNFTWIALLYFFNGHMLAHYSVGHITWGGTFLMSWFIGLVFALLSGERGAVWETKMAFLLFAVFLQGSFHQFVWCVIFLAVLAITYWKTFFPILRAGIAAGLLSAVRVIPPALQMGAFDDDFLGGYTLPVQVVNAFIKIIPPENSLNQAKTGAVLGWWEFDIYTGLFGLFFLAAGVIAWLLLRERDLGFPALIAPVAVLTVFSYRSCYLLLRFFRIPLFSGERVSSRFLILPFFFVLTAGTAALQRAVRKKLPRAGNAAAAAALIPAGYFLWKHLDAWKVTESAAAFPKMDVDLALKTVANHPDRLYTTGLIIGAVITVLTAAVLIKRACSMQQTAD